MAMIETERFERVAVKTAAELRAWLEAPSANRRVRGQSRKNPANVMAAAA
jgi:hypothetical protein